MNTKMRNVVWQRRKRKKKATNETKMINIKCKIKTSRKKQQQKEILHSRMQLANRLSIVIRSQTDQPSK